MTAVNYVRQDNHAHLAADRQLDRWSWNDSTWCRQVRLMNYTLSQ